MKIKTDIYAGMTYEQCDQERLWWKNQANMMEAYGANKSATPPAGLWFPCLGNPPIPGGGSSSGSGGSSSAGGGYVAGVWVPDMSGTCG